MKTCPLNMYGYGVRCVLLLASSPGCSSVYTKVLLMVLLFCLFWVFLNFEAFANNFPIRSLIFILCTVFFFCCTPAHFWSGVLAFQKQYHSGEQELTQMVVMSPGALTTSPQLYCFTIKTR